MNALDEIDLRILHELQSDGRISNQELADRVGLSPSPCLRRVRRLEQSGDEQGDHASTLAFPRQARLFLVAMDLRWPITVPQGDMRPLRW
jgi:predicted ArsR family transcriptional regulator